MIEVTRLKETRRV